MELGIHRAWRPDRELLDTVRAEFTYGPGDDRATGYLYTERGWPDWPAALSTAGPALLDQLAELLGTRFTIVAFQAYRNGSGCGWHTDSPFDAQAVLSLGVTRTFGIRRPGADPAWIPVAHGDLVSMPSGFQAEWEHCVPIEDVAGERVSLVFRTPMEG